MLSIISYKSISTSADLFFGQHRLRHQEFIERQSYSVKVFDGMEFDEYDTRAATSSSPRGRA
jgi:N-acyl-L-homoserine lactone synthetase